MKKILLLFLVVFGMLGFISCSGNNTEETSEEMNLNEQVEIPTNLAINNKTLTWNQVEGVSEYRVYANGEVVADVNTNSYDFSDLEGDSLIFTVKALAPEGMQNSNMSVTIAYLVNREQEVSALKVVLSENNMDLIDSDAFAEELADKGMTASQLGTMMSEFNSLRDEMNEETFDMTDVYDAIDSFMDSMDRNQIEAFISPFIKFELRVQIQAQIDYYKSMEDNYGYNYSSEIAMNQNILDFLDENVDEVIRSAMLVVDYIMDVQSGISTELIENFETIFEASSPDEVNVPLAITVKNELINNLKDSMPELEDVVILNYTIVAFTNSFSEDMINIDEMNITKQTAQSLMSIELFYNYLLAIDANYINDVMTALDKTEYEMAEDILILNLSLLDEFLEDNQALIQNMKDIYTDEEKEEMFFNYQIIGYANQRIMQDIRLGQEDIPFIKLILKNNINFSDVLAVQDLMNEKFNELLDAMVASDFEVIKKAFDVASLDYNDFDNYYEYSLAESELTFEMLNEVVNLLNPLFQDMTTSEYEALVDLGFGYLMSEFEIMNLISYGAYDIDSYEIIKTGIDNTIQNQLELFKLVFAEMDDEDLLLTISELESENTEESAYELMIVIANSYINIYDNGGEAHLDAITAEIISIISDSRNMVEFNLTQTEVDEITTLLNNYFEDIYDLADIIKDYDSTNLTAQQETNIQNFIGSFSRIYF